jgi:hypothetical protein
MCYETDCKYEVRDGWTDTVFLDSSDHNGEECGFMALGNRIDWFDESFDKQILSRSHIFKNETEAKEFVMKWQDGVGLDANENPVLKNIKVDPLAVPFYYNNDTNLVGYLVGGWAMACCETNGI